MKTRTAAVAAFAALSLAAAAPAPALASEHDCRILGPDYVSEVVDCAIYIYETAIGW